MGTQNQGTYHAIDIANYFLFKAQQDEELLSNLKLQKLVYYAQGLYSATHDDQPLFNEKIEAWTYGPVVPVLYDHYKTYGANCIPPDPLFDPSTIDKTTQDFLNEIYDAFGQFSAIRLMEISHQDQCWEDAEIGNEITVESMSKCLRKYLKNG
ncbi:MAG: SocA family protein [Desulfobacteraceae bacterium]|nr:SocA family protein [Desulfobacteraceae bacterium]MBC2754573.1 SocA family protein [Desulfobacteraceae bacterium]